GIQLSRGDWSEELLARFGSEVERAAIRVVLRAQEPPIAKKIGVVTGGVSIAGPTARGLVHGREREAYIQAILIRQFIEFLEHWIHDRDWAVWEQSGRTGRCFHQIVIDAVGSGRNGSLDRPLPRGRQRSRRLRGRLSRTCNRREQKKDPRIPKASFH